MVGFAVLRINRLNGDYPIGYIVELLAHPDHRDATEALIEASTKFFDENGVNVVRFIAVKNHPYVGLLLKHGFVQERMKSQVFLNNDLLENDWNTIVAAGPGELHFQYGDTDMI